MMELPFLMNCLRIFGRKLFLEYDEEEQFLEEIVENESVQEDFQLTMADRASIWSWVVVELEGVQSGAVYKDFVNEELA